MNTDKLHEAAGRHYRTFVRDGEYDCLVFIDYSPEGDDTDAQLSMVYYLGDCAQARIRFDFADDENGDAFDKAMAALAKIDSAAVDQTYREMVEPYYCEENNNAD
jgi:hypothetical protein